MKGSVLCTDPKEREDALKWGKIVIAQGDDSQISLLNRVAMSYYDHAEKRKPRLLVVDELHDFYTSGAAKRATGSDAIVKTARAGGERGMSVLCLAQRPVGIPIGLKNWTDKAYFFATSAGKDIKSMEDMGIPMSLEGRIPDVRYDFVYWTKQERKSLYGPYRLDL